MWRRSLDNLQTVTVKTFTSPTNMKYSQWSGILERKIKTILDSLNALTKTTITKNKGTIKKIVTTTLHEVVLLLEQNEVYNFEDYNAYNKNFKLVRESMLDLWTQLIDMVERVEESDATNFYKAILLIVKRYFF